MRKVRLKPPANDTRPVRRSLVELTEAASRAAGDGMLVMPSSLVTISVDDPPRPEEPARTPTAPGVPEPTIEPSLRPTALPGSDDIAEMLVNIAKAHQARALDSIRLGFGAALDYARDFVRTPMPADPSSLVGNAKPDDNVIAAVGAAAEFRAEALGIVKAQAATTLDYARNLAGLRTAAEFVELSGELARKQCEFMLRQAAVLQSFAQGLTKSGDDKNS
jgi:hypothetical protein